ncbi:MAG: hypothetical protein M3O36_11620 [Myxococcota bacterium]|nr:hypothetical protein [Myxococcota bacterium]
MSVVLALDGPVHAKPAASRRPSHEVTPPLRISVPAPPLPMLPSVTRVRVEAGSDRLLLVQELSLPRGDWQSGGLNFYVAFGAPGTPLAIDVRLVPMPRGRVEARIDDAGEALPVEPAVRRASDMQLLLGPPQMSGVSIRTSESQLRRAYAASDVVGLRIRSVLTTPAAGPDGARDLVVRLGIAGALPLTLGRIQLLSRDARAPIARAEARLCGPEADPYPLAIAVLSKSTDAHASVAAAIAPVMAVRHASDDLCIRWWVEGQ